VSVETRPLGAPEFLSVTTTVAALAVALVALRPDSPAAVPFLIAGLFAIGGSLYSLVAILEGAGIQPRRPFRGAQSELSSTLFAAVLCMIPGMLLLIGAYIALLIDSFRR
jgi:hypothetical protein